LKAKKSLGQNFLVDQNVIARIVGHVAPKSDELIIEIGPGHGILTEALLEKAGKVVAIEIDSELIQELKITLPQNNLELIHADVLDLDLEQLIHNQLNSHPELKNKVRIVANLPYYISTAILTKLISVNDLIQDMTLMLQREVAERIASTAGGKDYGILSVISQVYADIRVLFPVKAGSFRPIPKVESAILQLKVYPQPLVEVLDRNLFVKVVCAAFSERRKTILNSLKSNYKTINSKLDPSQIPIILEQANIVLTRRAETLSSKEFALLANIFYQY
jgi:16S rRNA (adenine1518-N6/adenine1519-N6)-dimethyltransferase